MPTHSISDVCLGLKQLTPHVLEQKVDIGRTPLMLLLLLPHSAQRIIHSLQATPLPGLSLAQLLQATQQTILSVCMKHRMFNAQSFIYCFLFMVQVYEQREKHY